MIGNVPRADRKTFMGYRRTYEQVIAIFVIVRLGRRDLVWINVTTNPTAEWIARQLAEAFPWSATPSYLIHDQDRIYGAVARCRMRAMGIRDKPTAPASPWQNGCAERLIGSIRRECVDHFIVLGEAHLRHTLRTYACYYNHIRTHWSFAPFNGSDLSIHTRSLPDFITITFGFRFSAHTAGRLPHLLDQSGQRWILACGGLSANDPKRTFNLRRISDLFL
jgi:Integrase core domain